MSDQRVELSLIVPYNIYPDAEIRMAGTKLKPLTCMLDLCRVMGKTSTSAVNDVSAGLDPDEKVMVITHTPGGPQEMAFLTEPGVYKVVVTARLRHGDDDESRERNARVQAFKRWLFHEVLPCIREYGCYPKPAVSDDPLAQTLRVMLAMREEQTVFQTTQLAKNVELDRRVASLEAGQVSLLRQVLPELPEGLDFPMTTWRMGVEALVKKWGAAEIHHRALTGRPVPKEEQREFYKRLYNHLFDVFENTDQGRRVPKTTRKPVSRVLFGRRCRNAEAKALLEEGREIKVSRPQYMEENFPELFPALFCLAFAMYSPEKRRRLFGDPLSAPAYESP